ncbi:uncharacterized protein LOC144690019 [Cetorhinus maximus]
MDDCNLKKLMVSPGTLEPPFNSTILNYKMILGSDVLSLTVHPVTSDNRASYQIIVYELVIFRVQFPWSINFSELNNALEYECPISLKAFYQPVSVKGSDPKHIFSSSCIKLLTRKTKCDPFDDTPFDEQWCVPEYEVDKRMSAVTVFCSFKYRGTTTLLEYVP